MKKNNNLNHKIGWFILSSIVALVGVLMVLVSPSDPDNPGGMVLLASAILYIISIFTKKSIYSFFVKDK